MMSFGQGILKSWETQKATIYSKLVSTFGLMNIGGHFHPLLHQVASTCSNELLLTHELQSSMSHISCLMVSFEGERCY
jgi:hypothetical protein